MIYYLEVPNWRKRHYDVSLCLFEPKLPQRKRPLGRTRWPLLMVCFYLIRLSSCGRFIIKGALGLRDDAVEGIDIVHSEVGKDLAVDFDVGGFETFDEA